MGMIETLEVPHAEGIGPSAFRKPDLAKKELDNLIVVSADDHFEITEDIFLEAWPEHLKDKAPRVWFDAAWRIGIPEADHNLNYVSDLSRAIINQHSGTGLFDHELRRQHLVSEGVDKEIVFPQVLLHFFGNPDLDVRERVFTIYNAYVARISAQDPGRFYGVGVCGAWWDAEKGPAMIRQIKALGLKTVLLPGNPGKYANGKPIAWGDEEMEPLWAAIAEAKLPVCFHISEKFDVDGRGVFGAFVLHSMDPFRKTFGQLAFGGVFDRNPALKVVFAEAGIAWIPPMLQDAELIYDSFGDLLNPKPLHRPSHYWARNCYASFSNDRLGLENLKYIGEDNVMWASDYPHTEGTFGYAGNSRQAVIDATSPEIARKILGETAMRVFNLYD